MISDNASMRARKPKLTVGEQIAHLKSKGVTFELCSEEEAAEYLSNANNYLRAASYRKLYPRQIDGPNLGSYINLDFEDLIELSSIDRRLREALLAASIDVEHFAKMELMRRCDKRGEDGYSIISDYLGSLSPRRRDYLEASLNARGGSGGAHDEYSGNLISHYAGEYPIWVFLEVVDFGTFADLWRFCALRWADKQMKSEHYVLKSVKALRNACAHNSLLVNGFSHGAPRAFYQPPRLVSDSLNRHGVKNTKARREKLGNLRMSQIAATLCSVNAYCSLESTVRRHSAHFEAVREYAEHCGVLSRASGDIVSFFDFTWKLVDVWLSV
ncbi:Abi family protein [Cryptobacterium curtum]|uniref:Abi family protein n=1 Tax=Cryptobacterium curtum TaxID=84163 RepID=UPI00248EB201|nr:Abi family protein [Cryptobacterium curtum]